MATRLSQQEELELWRRYKFQGDTQAKKRLLKSLRPLIQNRVNQFRNSGLPMSSMELEGMKLASQALDTYDPSKAQLNTHVTNYLKKVSRFATTYQNVGAIPEPRALMLGKYKTIYSNLQEEKGREPTVSELADAMNISEAEVERMQLEDRADLGIELRGDEGDEEGGGGFFYDMIEEQQPDPTKQALDFVYFDADPVNKKILEYSFGIGGAPQLNLTQIKQKLDLSDSELKKRKKKLATEIKDLTQL